MQQQSLLKVETVRDPAMLTAVSVDEKIKIDSVVMISDVSHRVQRMWFQKRSTSIKVVATVQQFSGRDYFCFCCLRKLSATQMTGNAL